jgi:hypothetical protein
MKILTVLAILILATVAYGQPIVDPEMIEITFDGVTFVPATPYVSDMVISVGTVPEVQPPDTAIYVGRGVVMGWAAQLGTPYQDQRVDWKLDTALIPTDQSKFSVRFRFAVGTTKSPYSEASDEITLIEVGKPGKPTVIIF